MTFSTMEVQVQVLLSEGQQMTKKSFVAAFLKRLTQERRDYISSKSPRINITRTLGSGFYIGSTS